MSRECAHGHDAIAANQSTWRTSASCNPYLGQTSPPAKSLLIFRNQVNPSAQKYSTRPVGQITSIIPPVSPDERGGSRSSRTRGGMRWTRKLRLTSAAVPGVASWRRRALAYGEIEQARCRDAGIKSVWSESLARATVAKEPVHRGELV